MKIYGNILEAIPTSPDKCDFEGQLCSAAAQISDFFESRRQLIRMLPSDESMPLNTRKKVGEHWQASRKRLLEAVASLIARGQVQKHIRLEIPAQVLAAYFLGDLRTRARHRDILPKEHQRPEAVVAMFLRGAAVHPGKVCCDQPKKP
ncbi:MAG: hypothetical protein HC898_04460 [Phycisphaerales bacterium]|nr:hypothetical protein [Phycisphaerales bacterium]